MATNEYTKNNYQNSIPSQVILDAGLNLFGLQLFLESYTDSNNPQPLKFRYLGVDVAVSIPALNSETEQVDASDPKSCGTCDGSGQIPCPDGFAICRDCSGG